jgi:hypothetical protein
VRLSLWGLLILLATGIVRAQAIDPAQFKAALEQPLLAPGEPLKEMRAFIEPRIIKMPEITDRVEWERTAARLRRDMLEQVVFRGVAAAAWRDAKVGVEWLDTIAGGPGYRIRKFRYEALPGMWIPGLLYLPDKLDGLVPLAVHVNGHAPEGKAVHYKQLRSINLAKRGMLVLNLEWFGMGQLRTPGFSHYRMNQLDLCGASGLAPFYLAISRAIDLGLALEHVDPKRVVVSGLSGGGWQTIVISSLDERVTLANPVAGYGGFRSNILMDDMGDSEQAPTDMGIVADYTHLTALRAPRPTLLTYNATDDCCFKSGHTLEPLLQAARPAFALYGAENRLRSHVNHVPGTHNFEQENREQLYAMIGDFFFPGDKSFVRGEIPSEAELKTAEKLHVPLPETNLDFHTLAESLWRALPRERLLPGKGVSAAEWQRQRRERLIALLKMPNYDAASADEKTQQVGKLQITSRRFKIGKDWTVPAVDLTSEAKKGQKMAIVLADAGRSSVRGEIDLLVHSGFRVLAVDPLLLGESKVKAQDPDYLYPLFVAAVGERPLGIQAGQLIAIARWARERELASHVRLVAFGPRAGMAALVATVVDADAVDGADLTNALASLKELIEQDTTVETMPELFAFGLLAEFDIPDLAMLVAPRRLNFNRDLNRVRPREVSPREVRVIPRSESIPTRGEPSCFGNQAARSGG